MSGNERVAAEIRAEMARQRISIRRIALMMQEPASTVARKLRGATPLQVDEVEAFAAVLSVSVMELVARAYTSAREPEPQPPTGHATPSRLSESNRRPIHYNVIKTQEAPVKCAA